MIGASFSTDVTDPLAEMQLADTRTRLRHQRRKDLPGLVVRQPELLIQRQILAAERLRDPVSRLDDLRLDVDRERRQLPGDLIDRRRKTGPQILLEIPESDLELVGRSGLRGGGPAELLRDLTQNDLLRIQRLAGLLKGGNLLLLLVGERHTRPHQLRNALLRVVQGLAELHRRLRGVDAERGAHVSGGLRRLIEDLVALAGLVADVRERQQQVLSGLDRLVVNPRLAADRRREVRDVLRGDVRLTARRLQDRLRLTSRPCSTPGTP
jgi:hypothetical protein